MSERWLKFHLPAAATPGQGLGTSLRLVGMVDGDSSGLTSAPSPPSPGPGKDQKLPWLSRASNSPLHLLDVDVKETVLPTLHVPVSPSRSYRTHDETFAIIQSFHLSLCRHSEPASSLPVALCVTPPVFQAGGEGSGKQWPRAGCGGPGTGSPAPGHIPAPPWVLGPCHRGDRIHLSHIQGPCQPQRA